MSASTRSLYARGRLAHAGRGCKKQRHPAGSGSIYRVAKEQKGAEKWEQLSAGPSLLSVFAPVNEDMWIEGSDNSLVGELGRLSQCWET